MRTRLARHLLLAVLIVAWTVNASPEAMAAVTSSVDQGVLSVTSDAEGDRIAIRCDDTGQVQVNGASPDTGAALCTDITSIVVDAGAGDDDVNVPLVDSTTFPAVTSVSIDGGEGSDAIRASKLPDSILGGPGADSINAASPELGDAIDGGEGLDYLRALIVDDVTVSDTTFTFSGSSSSVTSIEELSIGASDADEAIDARSYSGSLIVQSNGGNDSVVGGSGPNSINAGDGDDSVTGGPVRDDIQTGSGRDEASGRSGADSFLDLEGADRLVGGGGTDEFFLGTYRSGGGNTFIGGPGRDRVLVLVPVDPVLLIDTRLRSADALAHLRSIEFAVISGHEESGALHIDAQGFSGDTALSGDYGDDVILGGTGNDRIFGSYGGDELFGGPGSDLLEGGPGSDRCEGGPGRDRTMHCEQRQ